jgi:hypothetical protein
MSLPLPPNIGTGQIALDPINGIVYYKNDSGELVSTTWNWLQNDLTEISTVDDVTISSNLVVGGDLVIGGDTVSLNVSQVLIEDNILILNSNYTGAPTLNAGLEIERGSSNNVSIRWNESTDKWQVTEDGTHYYDLLSSNSQSVVTLTGEQTLTNKTLTNPVITGVSPTVTLAGDLSGSVTLTNLGNATLNATVINNSVALGTDTTGSYLLDVSAGTGISVSHTQGEGSTATVSLNATLDNLSDVVITSAANGQMLEFNGTNWVNAVRPSSEPMGHEDKSESTISFNEGTRTFSIAPVSTSFTVWCAGKRFVKTATETVEIPDTSGLYYIYFNSSGVLSYRTDYFVWDEDAPTAYVYWNEVDNKAYFFADERHGITLDWATHEYLHRTRGAAIANGFGANNYIINGNGSLDSHAKLDIADGTFFDEDLQVDISHSATPTPNTWEQVLQGNAEIPVFYRLNNHWTKDVATEFPLKQGESRPQYNLNTAGTWSATDIANNRFGVSWIIATNNLNEPIIAVLGQGSYTDNGSAQAEFYSSLNLDGFPIVEFRPLYKIIYECKDSYTNTPSARITDVIDLRSIISSDQGVGATAVSDHGSMTGLTDDDHTQYLNDSRHNTLDHSAAMSSVVLDDISDIDAPTPSENQVLAWDTTSGKWNAKTFTATVSSLDNVGDVTVSSPSFGDYLKWSAVSGVGWVNGTIALGTDTTGNYMSGITAGTGIIIDHTPGEGSSGSISIGQSVATNASVTFGNLSLGTSGVLSLGQSGTIVFEGSSDDDYETTLTVVNPTADRTISLPNASDTLVGKATTDTLTNKTLQSAVMTGTTTIQQSLEKTTAGGNLTGVTAIDLLTSAVYTYNGTGNFTFNFRGDVDNSLNDLMSTNQSITSVIFVTNTTARTLSAIQIQGTTSGVTTRWFGGSGIPSGNLNSTDVYTITIIKTGSATYTVYASQSKFA